jgi:hypothetical protein
MHKTMLENLKYNWSFMRIIRLILGFIVIGQSIVMKDVLFGIAGAAFVFMALFNMGCCGTGTCAPVVKNRQNKKEETSYEEVDIKQ